MKVCSCDSRSLTDYNKQIKHNENQFNSTNVDTAMAFHCSLYEKCCIITPSGVWFYWPPGELILHPSASMFQIREEITFGISDRFHVFIAQPTSDKLDIFYAIYLPQRADALPL
jgi:hypothetical protein